MKLLAAIGSDPAFNYSNSGTSLGDYGYLIILMFVFVFGLGSHRLTAIGLSPPLVFVVFGVVCGPYVLDIVELPREFVDPLAELTLMLVLFADASRIDLKA